MKKYFIITVSLLLLFQVGFSQTKRTLYLELKGLVGSSGDVSIEFLVKPKNQTQTDSLINYSKINSTIKLRNTIAILNKLSEEDWHLISTVEAKYENSVYVLYYFRKEIFTQSTL